MTGRQPQQEPHRWFLISKEHGADPILQSFATEAIREAAIIDRERWTGLAHMFAATWDDEHGLLVAEVAETEWQPAGQLAEWLDPSDPLWPKDLAAPE